MEVIYTGEETPNTIVKSLFLSGPSRRPDQDKIKSWREDALQYLEEQGFDGTVFCPETRNGEFSPDFNYDDQVEWEDKHLNMADCILFWVPRDLSVDNKGKLKLPALTTNIEAGRWMNSGKVVFGCPPDLEKG